MKVTIKANENAIERLAEAKALNRAQVQVLFGFCASALDGLTIQKIVDLALDLELDVTLNESAREITISA